MTGVDSTYGIVAAALVEIALKAVRNDTRASFMLLVSS